MTTEERLARIEEKLVYVVDGLSSLNQGLEKLVIPRLSELDSRLTRLEASVGADLKLLRVAVGVALLGGVSGGSSLVIRLLGIG